MRFNQWILLLGLVTLSIIVGIGICQEDSKRTSIEKSRSKLTLPKIFDFNRFKSLFKRKYKSILEELARKKIFLGRAFRAFLSYVGYKNYKSDKYLKISQLSDWTEAEFAATLNKNPTPNIRIQILSKPEDILRKTPVASEADLEAKLIEIRGQPKYADLEKELNFGKHSRRKRQVVSKQREHLALDDLFEKPKEKEELPRITSNNPNYQAPELTSFGLEDEDEDPMDIDESNSILSLPGSTYLGDLLSSTSDYFLNNKGAELGQMEASKLADKVYVDHRACLGSVKFQGQCGSCYIFGTNALYEWQFCKEHGMKVDFSEQYALDCGERIGLKGCEGGWGYQVAAFYGYFGIEASRNYPYRAQSDICPYDGDTDPKRMGYLKLNYAKGAMGAISGDHLQDQLNFMPLIVGIGAPADFSDYGGGVDDGKTCSEERAHLMTLVGSGRQDGEEYWLLRNSYSSSWGEEGYYKLNKKASKQCLMDNGVGYFVLPSENGLPIFQTKANDDYLSVPVNQRYYDVMSGKYIEPNPVNRPVVSDPNGRNIVTPSSKDLMDFD